MAVATPEEPVVATPEEVAVATPEEVAVATPVEVAVAMPEEVAVATPVEVAVATPVEVAVATPEEVAVATTEEPAVATPEPVITMPNVSATFASTEQQLDAKVSMAIICYICVFELMHCPQMGLLVSPRPSPNGMTFLSVFFFEQY